MNVKFRRNSWTVFKNVGSQPVHHPLISQIQVASADLSFYVLRDSSISLNNYGKIKFKPAYGALHSR